MTVVVFAQEADAPVDGVVYRLASICPSLSPAACAAIWTISRLPTRRPHARRLADSLVDAGKLHDDRWYRAVCAVPRHELVPLYYIRDAHGRWNPVSTGAVEGFKTVYSNKALFITDSDEQLSSSSMPGLMTRMLELLDVGDGHRVLEIGTGSGYTAALLCHRLGSEYVFSVDLNSELVDLARGRLARLGYRPTLVAADGAAGLVDHAPYQRILVTCAVRRVPWPWICQLTPGGLLLADVKLAISAGNLVLLHKTSDERAEGRFDTGFAAFMPLRTPSQLEPAHAPKAKDGTTRITTRPAEAWNSPIPWFLAQLTLPEGVTYGYSIDQATMRPTAATYTAPDGSWCTVDLDPAEGVRTVYQTGPMRLWDHVEHAHDLWDQWGQPGWEHFGLTVTSGEQRLWLAHTDWSRPLP